MPQAVKINKGKTFEFKAATGGTGCKYDWDTILNGQPWIITQGEDFHDPITRDDMKVKAKTAARIRYKTVKTSKFAFDANGKSCDKLPDNQLFILATPMTDDQRVEEDMKRAEEKEAATAKKAEKKAKAKAAQTTAATPPATEQPAEQATATA